MKTGGYSSTVSSTEGFLVSSANSGHPAGLRPAAEPTGRVLGAKVAGELQAQGLIEFHSDDSYRQRWRLVSLAG